MRRPGVTFDLNILCTFWDNQKLSSSRIFNDDIILPQYLEINARTASCSLVSSMQDDKKDYVLHFEYRRPSSRRASHTQYRSEYVLWDLDPVLLEEKNPSCVLIGMIIIVQDELTAETDRCEARIVLLEDHGSHFERVSLCVCSSSYTPVQVHGYGPYESRLVKITPWWDHIFHPEIILLK